MYTGLQILRAKIRGLQAAGESISHRITKSSGRKRHWLWSEKRRLGRYNRDHLIAYGLFRGTPYDRIERCAKENRPNAAAILELMKSHGEPQITRSLTLEALKTLLEGPR